MSQEMKNQFYEEMNLRMNQFHEEMNLRMNQFHEEILRINQFYEEMNLRMNQFHEEILRMNQFHEEMNQRLSNLFLASRQLPSSIQPVAQNIINVLPEIQINEVDKLEKGKRQCPICLSAFNNEEVITALPCRHFYHSKCILAWFKKRNTCPLCKTVIDDTILNQ